jgi:cell division transport system ATP-binding protein
MTTHNLPMLDKYPGIVYQCGEGKLEDITAQYRQFQQE